MAFQWPYKLNSASSVHLGEALGPLSAGDAMPETLEEYLHVDALRTVADDHFYHRRDAQDEPSGDVCHRYAADL